MPAYNYSERYNGVQSNSFQGTVYNPGRDKEWYERIDVEAEIKAYTATKALEAAIGLGWCYYQQDGYIFIQKGFSQDVLIWWNEDFEVEYPDQPVKDYWQSNSKNTKSADVFQAYFAKYCQGLLKD